MNDDRTGQMVYTLDRPVGLALYGRSKRKSVGLLEMVPLRSAPPTSGIFIQYRMRAIYERLGHTNRKYGGAASVALRRLASGGACGQTEALCGSAPLRLPWALTCAVLGAEPQTAMLGGAEGTYINTGERHKSGERTSSYSISKQFRASRA
eukprot:4624816-Pleurochrysis_carterae.AAC.1